MSVLPLITNCIFFFPFVNYVQSFVSLDKDLVALECAEMSVKVFFWFFCFVFFLFCFCVFLNLSEGPQINTAWYLRGHDFHLKSVSLACDARRAKSKFSTKNPNPVRKLTLTSKVEPWMLQELLYHRALCNGQPPFQSQCIYCSHCTWAVNVADWVHRH